MLLLFPRLILGLKGLKFDRVMVRINSFIAARGPSFSSSRCFSCRLALVSVFRYMQTPNASTKEERMAV